MGRNPPEGNQRIVPYLYVEDVRGYVDFLSRAFGMETRLVHEVEGDPEHVHAEAALGDCVVMIGRASPRWGTAAPKRLPALACSVYVYVDDVDEHFRRARDAGAVIESEPQDQPYGHRTYTARDPEGHQWYLATPLE
jgi:uncharacterized glyoxalase superfamily protein PhnB